MAPTGSRHHTRRRVTATLIALAATVAIWFAFVRSDEGGSPSGQRSIGGTVPPEVADLVAGLDLQQKVDGVLLAGFEGTDPAAISGELATHQLGGVFVGSENWTDPVQGSDLIRALSSAAKDGGAVPPIFASAQEGGIYRALEGLPRDERAIEIGDFAKSSLALEWERETGDALRTVGIRLNLAPIADVASIDSPIADRAFSDDPAVAAAMTAAAMKGCRQAEVACAPAHFPGNGAASQDTADGPATVSFGRPELEIQDLVAFRAAFAAKAPAVVLSNAFYAGFDPVTPASLSPEIATDLLRDGLGFQGVAITGDLTEGAITADYSTSDAAVLALQAGADLLQLGSTAKVEKVRAAIQEAVSSDALQESRLDEAVGRVLLLKRDLGLIE